MHRSKHLAAASVALAAIVLSAGPAWAKFGAYAYDAATAKFGYSFNEDTQDKADAAAIKGCGTSACKVVFRTGAGQCGAMAMTDDGKIWGGARRDNKDAAQLAALQDCQKRSTAQCKIRAAECNK